MPAKKKRTDAMVEEILRRMSNGEPLAQICRDEGMPHPVTWGEWCNADEALKIAHGRARDAGFDAIAADALRIADTPVEGVEILEEEDGTIKKKRADMLGHRKLQVETRLKLLAKWDPRRYGDLVKLSGSDGQSPAIGALAVTFVKSSEEPAAE